MKKVLLIALTSLSILSGAALAEGRDKSWRDIDRADEHVRKAIEILNRARNDNRLDKDGHGERALQLLRRVRSELDDSMDIVKRQK